MKCPWCNEDMEQGFIKSQEAGIYYLPAPGVDDSLIPTKNLLKNKVESL